MNFYYYLKNAFLILIFLQFAPYLIEGIRKQYAHYLTPKTPVGVLSIHGLLYDSSYYNEYLHKYFENPEVKAILLKIECAGGASGTSQALFNEIVALKKEHPKPVIVLIENICTSGAYYIACAADHIVAPGTSVIGSIGASMPYFFQLHDFIEQFKVHYIPMKTGTYKAIGDPFVDLTAQDKELLQGVLDDSYQQFIADVARMRKLALTNSAAWADGKVFSGNQAKQIGLIDEVGSAYTAIRAIKDKGLIEGEIEWIKPPQQTSMLNLFTGHSGSDDEQSMFASMATKVASALTTKLQSAPSVSL